MYFSLKNQLNWDIFHGVISDFFKFIFLTRYREEIVKMLTRKVFYSLNYEFVYGKIRRIIRRYFYGEQVLQNFNEKDIIFYLNISYSFQFAGNRNFEGGG